MNRYIAGAAVGLCLAMGSGAASAAAVLSMDMIPATGAIDASSNAQPSSSTTASIEFTGDGVVTNVSGAIEYDTTKVTVTNATAASGSILCSANNAFDPMTNTGRVAFTTLSASGTLATQRICTVTFAVGAVVPPTTATISFPAAVITFAGGTGSTNNGTINIQAGSTPPTVAFGTVTQPPGGGAGTAAGSVAVTVTDGGSTTTGPASVTLNCTLPAGTNNFSITSNATKTINAVASAANNYTIGVQCTRGASAGSSTLTCTQTTSPSVQRADLTQQIDCPQAGLAAPAVTYNPVPPGPINYTGNAGATATKTVTVSRAAVGGTGDAGATTTIQNCQVSAGFTLNSFANIVFPGGSGTPASGNISTSCTIPAFGSPDITGTLTCDEFKQQGASGDSTTPRVWDLNCAAAEPNFSSSPSPGGALPLAGPPNTLVAGSINVTNNGSAPLDFSCGTATGFTITNGSATGLAPGGSQQIGVSCTTPASPGATFSSPLQCTTNDPDFGQGVTFTLSCTAQILSIPTISAAGKTLLAALLVGLGLLGFTMRRKLNA